jgi:peptidoglycan/LPS O-acetylase OafA/YrhL
LDFLDALRGVAVGLVLLQHIGELLIPPLREVSAGSIQLGQFGVTVFFLCSGFIIPASLERGGAGTSRRIALTQFWTSRVFRLYPLYWLSLAAAGALVLLGRYAPARPMDAADWLANVSMFQLLVGSPHALGLYWTLAFEMIFYLAVSALFLLGWHRRSAVLSLLASGTCLAAAVLSEPLLDRPAPLGLFCLATMFTGTVFHRWHAGTVSLPTLAGCVAAVLGSGVALLASLPRDASHPELPAFVPMLTAWLAAYVVFCVGVALRGRRAPAWLRRLGTISFSVYLMQALVLAAVPPLPSRALTALVWLTVTIVLSEATYRLVERPAVRLGRTAAGRLSAPGVAVRRRVTVLDDGGRSRASAAEPVAA